MNIISGGITAPIGFTAGAVYCGVKKAAKTQAPKEDLALILSETPCAAAAVYTRNRVKAAPIYVTQAHLKDNVAHGIVVNSGNANACCPDAQENAFAMCSLAAAATGRTADDFIVASTGVIGQRLNIAAIEAGMPEIVLSKAGGEAALRAIMTTDTTQKQIAATIELGGRPVTIGAIAKGSGMIHPNMGTMLCFVTTDCAITPPMLRAALDAVVPRTFNRVTVDGDTSTNDMCAILANGMAKNPPISAPGDSFDTFSTALRRICEHLSRAIAADGEGASRLLTCTVQGADDEHIAQTLAMSVLGSPLVKSALFGADANWGRILCAMGYAGVPFKPDGVDVAFHSPGGTVAVCKDGLAQDFDEAVARAVLSQPEVIIEITLREGDGHATCWGCDLTYDYVKINGDYRT